VPSPGRAAPTRSARSAKARASSSATTVSCSRSAI
jgi:hypothetical protein